MYHFVFWTIDNQTFIYILFFKCYYIKQQGSLKNTICHYKHISTIEAMSTSCCNYSVFIMGQILNPEKLIIQAICCMFLCQQPLTYSAPCPKIYTDNTTGTFIYGLKSTYLPTTYITTTCILALVCRLHKKFTLHQHMCFKTIFEVAVQTWTCGGEPVIGTFGIINSIVPSKFFI